MKLRTYILLSILLTSLLSLAGTYTPQNVPNVHISNRTRYVSNPDGVLSPQAEASLNTILADVWTKTTAEPAIVAINDMAEGFTVDEFANELFSLWGLGKSDKDNGLLILIVKNPHQWSIRTGYGLEGILNSANCGTIMRSEAIPAFKNDDYDGGTIAATKMIASVLSNPDTINEISSKQANDSKNNQEMEFFPFMILIGIISAMAMLFWILWIIYSTRKKSELERYRQLNNAMPVTLFVTFFGLGIPLPAYLICIWMMKRLRNHSRSCPNCGATMEKLDEDTDNQYLTPAQDAEERLNSIDYDVWLCRQCGEKDVIPYENKQSAYIACPQCGARTCALSGNRIIRQPSTQIEGQGIRIYSCRNCGKDTLKPYNIAKLAAPVVFIPGGGGGFGSGGGGGFSGGSFGGGVTGGGGASGSW